MAGRWRAITVQRYSMEVEINLTHAFDSMERYSILQVLCFPTPCSFFCVFFFPLLISSGAFRLPRCLSTLSCFHVSISFSFLDQ